jgi:hypothetical protein
MSDLPDLNAMSKVEKLAHYKANEPQKPENFDDLAEEHQNEFTESHARWVEACSTLETIIKENNLS